MRMFTHIIADPLGLHARPAGMLVKAATGYACTVTLEAPSGKADAKRIMAVMRLAAKQGKAQPRQPARHIFIGGIVRITVLDYVFLPAIFCANE